jgi:hypothetical protein
MMLGKSSAGSAWPSCEKPFFDLDPSVLLVAKS